MVKIKVIGLAISLSVLFGAIAHGAETQGKGKHAKGKQTKEEAPTVITFDGSKDAPENEFPTITDKGKL